MRARHGRLRKQEGGSGKPTDCEVAPTEKEDGPRREGECVKARQITEAGKKTAGRSGAAESANEARG